MPIIKEEDLLSLHDQIEQAEKKQKTLEQLLDKKTETLQKTSVSKRKWKMASSTLLMTTLLLFGYYLYVDVTNSRIDFISDGSSVKMKDSTNITSIDKSTLYQKVNLKNSSYESDLYESRELISKGVVYSVQIAAFIPEDHTEFSADHINGLSYKDPSYNKLSLGIFPSLEAAQDFRKILIASGFSKNIFVISYQNGERLAIEDYK
ncbi:hypothetical protein [Aquimarina intermedia]|uniref:Sporulation related protein n=1 Tax=Aquimarina intermedia TaxID=350814 RepID=A0A5S5C6P3_9FLAO|nr:hypothetical protein [Aquimarina intermedia]TYP75024.1 hypothetical protein BD809_10386 [Aquimarina intermedia]